VAMLVFLNIMCDIYIFLYLVISSKRLLFKECIANCVGLFIDTQSRIMISVVDITL
jgi:hypothetical protein